MMYIKDYIIDNSYFKWLEEYLEQGKKFHYFISHCNEDLFSKLDAKMILITEDLMKLVTMYSYQNKIVIKNLNNYYIKYNEKIYHFYLDYEMGYECLIEKNDINENSIIDYEKFRLFCKKNMQDNFERLDNRVFECLNNTDLAKINYELRKIDGPTLVSGVGGSSVVATYASKILSNKNRIITRVTEPRDFNYLDLNLYQNVLACSYSGNNYGVELAFQNNLKHYLLAGNENKNKDIINLTYKCLSKENSFISLAATLIPCSILLNYYLNNEKDKIIDNLKSYDFNFNSRCDVYEIFSGYDTITASKYLESTFVEAGIGIPIIHDKYSYCHGRSTLAKNYSNIAIYFNSDTELDQLLLKELPKYYQDVIILNYNSNLYDEYSLLVKCMYLTKYIAEQNQKDLGGVDYNPIVKKLYKYKGNL